MNMNTTKVMRISRKPFPLQSKTDKKQLENVEYLKYLGNMIPNDAKCTLAIQSRIAMAKAAFHKNKTFFTSKLDSNLRKKLVKCYIWSTTLYGAGNWTVCKVDQKHLESFEMWCWRRTEKISYIEKWGSVTHSQGEKEHPTQSKRRKANWIGHILYRTVLKHIIEGKIKAIDLLQDRLRNKVSQCHPDFLWKKERKRKKKCCSVFPESKFIEDNPILPCMPK